MTRRRTPQDLGVVRNEIDRRAFVKRLGVAGGAVAFAPFLAACGGGDSGGGGDDGGSASLKDIKLGYSLPLTGPLAATFGVLFVPANLALKEVAAKGKVSFAKSELDDKGDPSQVPGVFRRFSQQDTHFVVGPNSSSTALAALPIATQLKILSLPTAVAPELGDPTKYPYAWQMNANADQEAQTTVEFLSNRGVKRVGMLQADDAFGDAMLKSSQKYLKEKGIELVSVQKHESVATNIAPYLNRLKSAKVDAIMQWQTVASAIAATYKALHNMSWSPMLVGHCSVLTQTAFDAAPLSVTKNVYGFYQTVLTYTDSEPIGEKQKAYIKALAANTGKLGGQEAVIAVTPSYDFVHALADAIEKAGTSDAMKVNETLEATGRWEGTLGTYDFNAKTHAALTSESMTMATLASLGDKSKSQVWFRERAEA